MAELTDNQQDLNRQRRLAVQLRLDGSTLAQAALRSGLSNPTIIAAHKAYLDGGWEAVEVKPRGRPRGEGRLDASVQQALKIALLDSSPESADPDTPLWHHEHARQWLAQQGQTLNIRSCVRYLEQWGIEAGALKLAMANATDPGIDALTRQARQQSASVFWCDVSMLETHTLMLACSSRRQLFWQAQRNAINAADFIDFLSRLHRLADGPVALVLRGLDFQRAPEITGWLHDRSDQYLVHFADRTQPETTPAAEPDVVETNNNHLTETLDGNQADEEPMTEGRTTPDMNTQAQTLLETQRLPLTHLQRLEAESIHIMREVVAEADNPVLLYSVGKDSAVLLHLARKAFYPAPPPFPLLHVDTTWKFRAMYEFRDRVTSEYDMELLIHTNADGVAQGVNPFTHGSALHTDIMKTEALKQALTKYNFDAAIGGARRDEEKSRAKERVFSFRTDRHRWDPKDQRPELWQLYNGRKRSGESIRAFPLSNWTELDIWQYIYQQSIPIVPLYFAAKRPVVERDGMLIVVDDDRMPLNAGEIPVMREVRFRTLGCYPLTGAVESGATTLPQIIQEMLQTRTSERQGRTIDHDAAASMEKKKQEGYF